MPAIRQHPRPPARARRTRARLSSALIAAALVSACTQTTVIVHGEGIDEGAVVADLEAGLELMQSEPRAAIAHFDRAGARCEPAVGSIDPRYFSAYTPEESIFYLVLARAEEQNATVLSRACGDAFYLAGFAYTEVGDHGRAEDRLRQALKLAPHNPIYLIELGHALQAQARWEDALATFKAAADSTNLAAEESELALTGRALRGVGFSLIELGRLDEAEATFAQCLDLDPDDERARHELRYISELRKQT